MIFKKYLDFLMGKKEPTPMERMIQQMSDLRNFEGNPEHNLEIVFKFRGNTRVPEDIYKRRIYSTDEDDFISKIRNGEVLFDHIERHPCYHKDKAYNLYQTFQKLLGDWILKNPYRNMETLIVISDETGIKFSDIKYRVWKFISPDPYGVKREWPKGLRMRIENPTPEFMAALIRKIWDPKIKFDKKENKFL